MAIFNKEKQILHLVRDRYGVKPLYIYEDEEVFAFASEAKVILDFLDSFRINEQGLAQYMWYGNTTGTQTMVEGLKKLEPGTHLQLDLKGAVKLKEERFWSIEKDIEEQNISEDEAVTEVRKKLEAAVERQLVADVPLGVLLSGGIDSSAVVAMASKHISGKLDTYTAFYDYNIGGVSELSRAKIISKKYGTNHHEIKIGADDVKEIFQTLVYQYDEPFADAGNIPLFQLAKGCSLDKKVILQGDGGDEFFAGYDRYNIINHRNFWKYSTYLHRLIPENRFQERLKRLNFVLNQQQDSDLFAFYLTQDVPYKDPYNVLNYEVKRNLENIDWKADYTRFNNLFRDKDLVQRLLYIDTSILLPHKYLEKVDKATMFCSLESRVPFLDNELSSFALSLPSSMKVKKGQKKYLLKQALKDLVPDEILYGKKRGFDVPYKHWLKNGLYNFAKDSFLSTDNNIVNGKACFDLLERHKKNEADYGPVLWKMLVLTHWLDLYKNKITE